MKLSDKGREFIKEFEGFSYKAYQDVKGVWTIGYGHTHTAEKGQTITEYEADRLLAADVAWAEQAVHELVKVKLNQNQFDSLVEFVFNVGKTQFLESTLLDVLNRGDYLGVPQELVRWNKSGGKRWRGLVRRRLESALMFIEN